MVYTGRTEIRVANHSGISDLAQYFPPGTQYLYANFTSTVRLQYLMLPVLVKYTYGPG